MYMYTGYCMLEIGLEYLFCSFKFDTVYRNFPGTVMTDCHRKTKNEQGTTLLLLRTVESVQILVSILQMTKQKQQL